MEGDEGDRKRPARDLSAYEHQELQRVRPRTGDIVDSFDAWNLETQRIFVEAIFKLGMSRASPNVVTQFMRAKPAALTAERIKSHLQKFRQNSDKSLGEFLSEYDAFLAKSLTESVESAVASSPSSPVLLGGEPAALATYSYMRESGRLPFSAQAARGPSDSPLDAVRNGRRDGLQLPFVDLSDAELQSPIGKALFHVTGLLHALKDQIQTNRIESVNTPIPYSHTTAASVSQSNIDEGIDEASTSLTARGASVGEGEAEPDTYYENDREIERDIRFEGFN